MTARTEANGFQAINSPLKWVGGKSRLRKQIINLFPPHTCYLELFSGAAWVLFAKKPSPVEVLNDIDEDLINFFRVVKNRPEQLIEAFDFELVSRAEFERLAGLDPSQLTEIQRAHRFYYIIMAGWGGELNYPRFQTSITDGGGGNRLIGALKTLRERLDPVHARLRSVIIECLDWRSCLDRYDREGTLAYVDPPYPENGCNYKHNMRSWEEHRALAERLHRASCKWIYSSYDTSDIRELFPKCHVIPVTSASGMADKKRGSSRTTNQEVLITNFSSSMQEVVVAMGQEQTSLVLDSRTEPYNATVPDKVGIVAE